MKVSTRIQTPLTATTKSANGQARKRENTDGSANLELTAAAPPPLPQLPSRQPPGDAPHTHVMDGFLPLRAFT